MLAVEEHDFFLFLALAIPVELRAPFVIARVCGFEWRLGMRAVTSSLDVVTRFVVLYFFLDALFDRLS